jgi:hypothetical protein
MSDTPESTPANLPAEAQAAQQSELCFGEVETQNERQIEMRFETDETRAETKNEPLAQTPNQTQAETRNAIRFETVGIQVGTQVGTQIETQADPVVEPQAETHVKTQAETPNQTQAETRNELRFETVGIPVATQAVTPTEGQTETRVEIGQVEIQNEKQAGKPATPRPEPQAVTLNDRPFRVKLRGSVLVLIRLPNKRQLRAALHQLSTTGGVINLEKPLDEKIEVELIFHIDRSTIRGDAGMDAAVPLRGIDGHRSHRSAGKSAIVYWQPGQGRFRRQLEVIRTARR